MAINWNLMQQGVDLTGFGQGIAQGIRLATERKIEQEKMFDSEWKEYSRMFDPSKISEADRADYIQAYSETHKIAKALNRAEKGSSTDEINNLDLQLQRAQAKMASIYGRSKMKNEKVLLINKEIERLQKAGYVIPEDYKIYRNTLVTKRQADITDDELEGDFKIDLMPTTKQEAEIMNLFDKTKTIPTKSNETKETIKLPVIGNVNIYKYTPGFVADDVSIKMNEDTIGKTNHINYGIETAKWLKQNLNMPDGSVEKEKALSYANDVMKKAKLNSIDEIQPKHIAAAALGLYNQKTTGKEVIDNSELTNAMKKLSAMNAQERLQVSKMMAGIAQQRANTDKSLATDLRVGAFLANAKNVTFLKNSPEFKQLIIDKGMNYDKYMKELEKSQRGKEGIDFAEAWMLTQGEKVIE